MVPRRDYEATNDVYKQDLALYRIEEQDDLIIPPNGYQMTQGSTALTIPFGSTVSSPTGTCA